MISEVPKNYSQFPFRFLKRIDIEFFKSRLQINSLEWIFKLESKFLKELCNSCKIKGLWVKKEFNKTFLSMNLPINSKILAFIATHDEINILYYSRIAGGYYYFKSKIQDLHNFHFLKNISFIKKKSSEWSKVYCFHY